MELVGLDSSRCRPPWGRPPAAAAPADAGGMVITTQGLAAFLRNPVKEFFRHRLQVTFRDLDAAAGDEWATPTLVDAATAPALITGTPTNLLLDVYQPTGDALAQRPALIAIHGGAGVLSKTAPPNEVAATPSGMPPIAVCRSHDSREG